MSFFDKMGKAISDATSTVVEKTKSSTDTIRLNGQINDEERKIQTAYVNIGKKYVELHKLDAEPEFQEELTAIAESQRKITEYQAQIRKNKHMVLCTNCGAEISETLLHCTSCGAENPVGQRLAREREEQAAAQRAAEAAAAAGQICPKCGKPRTAGARFCTGCGMAFPASEPTAAPAQRPCPKCGAMVPVESGFCMHCGASMQMAAPAPAPAPKPVPAVEPVPVTAPEPSAAESVYEAPQASTASEETVDTHTAVSEEAVSVDVRRCPVCNAVVPPENRFCTTCGQAMEETPASQTSAEPMAADTAVPVEEPAVSAEPAGGTCPTCGSFVPAENRFCTKCGHKMEA